MTARCRSFCSSPALVCADEVILWQNHKALCLFPQLGKIGSEARTHSVANYRRKLDGKSGGTVRSLEYGTDNVGKDQYNLQLSDERAKSVAPLLQTHGTNPPPVTKQGPGKANPKTPNTSHT